ncbi:MAG: molybdenum cofactor cytidylyltransferase [Desulfobacterales bacterium]
MGDNTTAADPMMTTTHGALPKGPIAGIILAAGLSSRMGRMKLLMPYQKCPLLQHVVDAARDSSLDPVIVVLGHRAHAILRQVDFENTRVVMNPDFREGQSRSLQAGLREVPQACDGALFLLGDQPRVDTTIIDDMIFRYRSGDRPIIVPVYRDKPGNPVLFGRLFFDQLMALHGDIGGRHILHRHEAEVMRVTVPHNGIHLDIDTWKDYRRLTANEAQ